MRKRDFCRQGADQLRSNCEADQHLCFRYMDSTIFLRLKFEILSDEPASVTVQVGLRHTWSETPKTGFLASWLSLPFGDIYPPTRDQIYLIFRQHLPLYRP